LLHDPPQQALRVHDGRGARAGIRLPWHRQGRGRDGCGRGRRSGGSGGFGSSNPQDPRRSRAVPGRLPPSQAAIQLGSREAEAARGVQQAPMIERPSLEEAARSWLRKNEDLSPAEEVLKQALTEFVEKRFRGAAEELRRVHAI